MRDFLRIVRSSAPRSSPSMSAVTPIAIAPVGDSRRSNVVSTSEASSAHSTNGGPRRQQSKSARVQPLNPRDSQIEERGKLDIWMLGLTIVIGGQYFSWNAGLAAGCMSYFLAFLLIAMAYITLCSCTAEITGALPFAGGAYGLSRCTLGFFPGFMIGCCEALEYIAYVSTTAILLGDLIIHSIPSLAGYAPLLWLAFYVSTLAIQIRGGRVFWRFNLIIGAISLLIVVVYVFGSLPWVDFSKHTQPDPNFAFVGGVHEFMRVLPLAAWFFVGVEALSMASDDVNHPKKIVPVAHVACVVTLAVTGLAVYFVSISLPHGDGGIAELATVLAPLDKGFELMFKISQSTATLLSLPATYATAFGFVWCYGKVISSMATSRLLPPFLAQVTNGDGVPYVALIAGSILSYGLCVLVYLEPSISRYLFSICITSGFVAYSGQCIGYISLKKNYRSIKSSAFTNPFGMLGALFSLSVWLCGIVSIAGFQGNSGIEILTFLGMVASIVVLYYAYAKKRQTFSPQENKVLLVAHVMKFNATRFSGKGKSNRSRGTSRATTNNNNTNHTNHSSHARGAATASQGPNSVAEN